MSLTPEQIEAGWVEHDGGPMPVKGDQEVAITLRSQHDGQLWYRGGSDFAAWFNSLNWWEGSRYWQIIAYRPEPKP